MYLLLKKSSVGDIMCEKSNDDFKENLQMGEWSRVKNVNFEEALNYIGYGKFDFCLILASGLCLFGVNADSYGTGYILPAAECDLNLDTYRKGIITATSFTGIMISSLFWGYLSDTKGRRAIIIISLILSFICTILTSIVPSFWGFAILRFLGGICLSGPSSITFVFVGEFQNRKNRSKSTAWASLFIGFALIYLPGVSWIILPLSISWRFWGIHITSWRIFILLMGFIHIVSAFLFYKLPESPRYLYHSGKYDETLKVLKKIYQINTGRPDDTFQIESLEEDITLQRELKKRKNPLRVIWNQTAPLFMPPQLKYFLSACFIQAATFALSSGFFMWYPDIINQLAKSSNSEMTVCEALESIKNTTKIKKGECLVILDDEIFKQNLLLGVIYTLGYSAWSLIVNITGNRNFFIICMAISGIATGILNFFTQKVLIDILFLVLLMLPGISIAVINVALVDTIPTYLCGMAVSLSMTIGRFGSIVSSLVAGIMLQFNCNLTFQLYSLSLIVSLALAFIFPNKPKT